GKTVARELRSAGYPVIGMESQANAVRSLLKSTSETTGRWLMPLPRWEDRHDGIDAVVHLAAMGTLRSSERLRMPNLDLITFSLPTRIPRCPAPTRNSLRRSSRMFR